MPPRSTGTVRSDGTHLRLLCPKWQGAGTSGVRDLASELPVDLARRGYAVGTAVLQAVEHARRLHPQCSLSVGVVDGSRSC
jgi:hypothetical protein